MSCYEDFPMPPASEFSEQEKQQTMNQLRHWFELDTWSVDQAFRLLAGIDPYQSKAIIADGNGYRSEENPCWGVLCERIRLGDAPDANGLPPVLGEYFVPWQMMALWRLLRQWLARVNANHKFDPDERHPPTFFIAFATDKGLSPFWLEWAIDGDLFSPQTTVQHPSETVPQAAPAQAPRLLRKANLIAELEKEWPTIRNDIANQTRGGELSLKKAAYRELAGKKQGAYDVEAAKQWAKDNLKWKQQTAEAAPPPTRKPASAFDGLGARAGKR